MIHKLLAGKGKMKRGLSLLLCLALLGSSVISSNVTAEAESEVTVETVDAAEAEDDGNTETVEAEITETTTNVESTPEETDGTAETSAEAETTNTGALTLTATGEATTEAEETTEEAEETPAEENSTATVPAMTLTGEADGVSVSVYAPEGSFTEEVTMVVSEADTGTFLAAVTADIEADGGTCTVYDSAIVEISFYNVNGEEVEPVSAVEVTLGNLNLSMGDNDLTKYAIIYHMDDDGNANWIMDGDEVGASSYTFSATSFSTYGVVIASVEYGISLTAGNELDQSKYVATCKVYYDTFTVTRTDNGKIIAGQVNANARANITSVELNKTSVTQADSSSTRGWSGGTQVGTYFPNATTSKEETATLTITPASGYYVTAVVIACTSGSNTTTPYNCNTWKEGNAYNASFTVGTGGAVSVTVSSEDFSHGSNTQNSGKNNNYFILIEVAPIPSPLYVEYDYGNIVSYIDASGSAEGSSAFASADGWTTESSGNVYGSGYNDTNGDTDPGVKTEYTQYKYAYSGTSNASAAASWKHYANTITEEAKKQAAAAGYVFAGWKAEYYTKVTVSSQNADANGYQDAYNNWDYTFTTSYGESTYNEGDEVKLTTNVRLTALWLPIGIQIEKTVSGLPSDYSNSQTYTITLQDASENTVGTYEASVAGNGTSVSSPVYLIKSGTYQVVETDYPSTITYNDTTYYLVSSSGESITIGVPETTEYTIETVKINGIDTEVAVMNTVLTYTNVYSDSDSYIIVQKTFEGLDADEIPEDFAIEVTNTETGTKYTLTINDKNCTSSTGASTGNVTYTWKVTGADLGTYSVSESGENVVGYSVATSGDTGSNVSVTATKFDVSVEENKSNKETQYKVYIDEDTSNFFAVRTTGTEIVVITKNALSAGQKAKIETALLGLGANWSNAKTIIFYSIEQNGESFPVLGGTATYDNTDGTITFSSESLFNKTATGSYSISAAANNPEISITNTYTPDTTTLTVEKTVTGNMGDTSKYFDFTLTLVKDGTDYIEDLNVKYSTAAEESTLGVTSGTGYSFSLASGQSIEITVPVGYTYTVTESDYSSEGYTTKIDGTVKRVSTDVIDTDAISVAYVNDKTVSAPTGLTRDVAPYVAALAIALGGAVLMFVSRRRRV